ncbi:MAG: S8 family serine peptidase [Parashewanella sp.]
MNTKNRKTVLTSVSSIALAVAGCLLTGNTAAEEFTALNAQNFSITQDSPLPKRYIVKFKDSVAQFANASSDQVTSLSGESEVQSLELFSHLQMMSNMNAQDMKQIGNSRSYSAIMDDSMAEKMSQYADVEYVEEDLPRRFLAQTVPWGQTFVGATSLNDRQSGNRTICIIDSGYDLAHNDLSGNQVSGSNNSGTGQWNVPGANNAHGTHVAGTIAAINNSEGVVGVLPNQNAKVHVIKVFNSSGWGYSSSLVSAINTCVSNGSNVVTMSLGGAGSSTTERNAMQSVANNGVLLIAAAGNSGNSTKSYPASYDSVMSVAAVDSNKQHATFSQYNDQVEISGPGEAILSTVTVGEGRLANITVGSTSYFDNGVVPHSRVVGTVSKSLSPIHGTYTGELAECSVSGASFNCGNMTNKVCLVERVGNQSSSSRPEINAVKACENAGARATIVFSNSARSGLQNPFVMDDNSELQNVSVSVDRATGLALRAKVGQSVTVSDESGKDYAYYNGTSMATPHVSGVATLVWSYHPTCTAAQIRNALNVTAEDIDVAGVDIRTGNGLVNAQAAKAYLDESCNGPTDPGSGDNVLKKGVAKTGLSGNRNEETVYRLEVPAGATNLSFTMSGGSGDADLYVRQGAEPTTSTFDCRPYKSGNNEACSISDSDVQAGTYYVMIRGYSAYSGVSLVANYDAASGGAPSTYTNSNDFQIPDNNSTGITSPITVTRTGDSGTVSVTVDIRHTYKGDLKVDLIAANGQSVTLHSNTGGGSDNIQQTYSINAAGVESQGIWRLKVVDSANQDTGYINSWTLKFD